MANTVFLLIFSVHCFIIINASETLPNVCPTIVSRKSWGGQGPETVDYVAFPLDIVIIHHTVTGTCRSKTSCSELVRSIQNHHIDKLKFGDIGYNFLIGGDGNVYEGRGWHKQGAHLRGYNTKSIGIAFIGNFKKTLPSDDALQAAKQLMACAVEIGELSNNFKLYGAKQLSATQSPGAELYNRIRNWDHFVD